jgi:tripartite ATP-independent transporter DctP family solute receptor
MTLTWGAKRDAHRPGQPGTAHCLVAAIYYRHAFLEPSEEKAMRRSYVAGAVAAALVLFGSAVTYSAEYRAQTFRLSTTTPKGAPAVDGMERFAQLVGERSGGKMNVRVFPNGQLGGDIQTVASLQGGGGIDMTVLNAGLLTQLAPDFAILDFPFLITDPSVSDRLLDGSLGRKLNDQLPAKNLIGLAYWELGFRNLTNSRRPIKTLADIAGLKIRVLQSPLFIEVFGALGANPVPLPYPELYTALEQKVVDGQENPATQIWVGKIFEVQKYMTLSRHVYNPQIVLFSKPTWDRLNADERKLLVDVAQEVALFERKLSRDADAKAVADIKAAGITVDELAPGEVDKIRTAIRPVLDKFAAKINPAIVKEVYDAVGVK